MGVVAIGELIIVARVHVAQAAEGRPACIASASIASSGDLASAADQPRTQWPRNAQAGDRRRRAPRRRLAVARFFDLTMTARPAHMPATLPDEFL